jgi:hypothetical protein
VGSGRGSSIRTTATPAGTDAGASSGSTHTPSPAATSPHRAGQTVPGRDRDAQIAVERLPDELLALLPDDVPIGTTTHQPALPGPGRRRQPG